MGKIVLNMAISLDGFICDEAGGFDWIRGQNDSSADTIRSYDFTGFVESVDTIVMGSLAYEDCILSGLSSFDDKTLLVATTRKIESRENVTFINGNVCEKVLSMKENTEGDIWLFGGAGLTDKFIKADAVDKYIIGIIPVILGKGRLLFKGGYPEINLNLDDYFVNDGITVLVYTKRNKFSDKFI